MALVQVPLPDVARRRPLRPRSPHLQIYEPQLTSGMSIFLRFTGIGLCGAAVLLAAWLALLAFAPEAYDDFTGLLTSPIGLCFLAAWTWALFYHMCCGVRHLFWDAGRWLSLPGIYLSGYGALLVSTALTGLFWALILGRRFF